MAEILQLWTVDYVALGVALVGTGVGVSGVTRSHQWDAAKVQIFAAALFVVPRLFSLIS